MSDNYRQNSGITTFTGYERAAAFSNDSKDESSNSKLAQMLVEEIRRDVKSKGHKVEALEKRNQMQAKQTHRQQLANNNAGPGGAMSHPELADMNGMADNIILPESIEDSLNGSSNDPKLQNKLKQKLAQKLGMGSIGSLSKEALEQELKKKHQQKMRMLNKPDAPRFSPKNAPKPSPSPAA